MIKQLTLSILISAAVAFSMPVVAAESATGTTQKKAPAKKQQKKTPAKKAAALPDPQEPEPSIADAVGTEYNCELNHKVTTYHNANDDSQIAVRWQNRLYRLDRVGTSSGANRFENQRIGLVWIGIPAKSMLLDSKKGQQLANECRNTDQMKTPVHDHADAPKS
jgi:hypothetical protein